MTVPPKLSVDLAARLAALQAAEELPYSPLDPANPPIHPCPFMAVLPTDSAMWIWETKDRAWLWWPGNQLNDWTPYSYRWNVLQRGMPQVKPGASQPIP